MTNDNVRTLSDVVRESTEEVTQNTFLLSFNHQLAIRFPNLRDWRNIDYNEVRSIAEFCTAINVIGIEVWNEINQTEVSGRQRMIRQGTRTQAA
jgi:hypothetical protein